MANMLTATRHGRTIGRSTSAECKAAHLPDRELRTIGQPSANLR